MNTHGSCNNWSYIRTGDFFSSTPAGKSIFLIFILLVFLNWIFDIASAHPYITSFIVAIFIIGIALNTKKPDAKKNEINSKDESVDDKEKTIDILLKSTISPKEEAERETRAAIAAKEEAERDARAAIAAKEQVEKDAKAVLVAKEKAMTDFLNIKAKVQDIEKANEEKRRERLLMEWQSKKEFLMHKLSLAKKEYTELICSDVSAGDDWAAINIKNMHKNKMIKLEKELETLIRKRPRD